MILFNNPTAAAASLKGIWDWDLIPLSRYVRTPAYIPGSLGDTAWDFFGSVIWILTGHFIGIMLGHTVQTLHVEHLLGIILGQTLHVLFRGHSTGIILLWTYLVHILYIIYLRAFSPLVRSLLMNKIFFSWTLNSNIECVTLYPHTSAVEDCLPHNKGKGRRYWVGKYFIACSTPQC